MTNLEKFQYSQAWSNSWNLPLCSEYNNPWIYCAYAQKILKQNGETLSQASIETYGETCQEKKGLYNRWPDGRGGLTSSDELVGMAYLSKKMASAIVDYLYFNDGIYNNTGEFSNIGNERFDMKRFIYLIPFLRSRADMVLSPFTLTLFSTHVIKISFSKDISGNKLLVDIMREEMSKYFVCKMAYKVFDYMQNRFAVTKQKCLENEIKAYPIYSQISSNWS